MFTLKIKKSAFFFLFLNCAVASGSFAAVPSSGAGTSSTELPQRKLSDYVGMSYMSFFNGPGLSGDFWMNPGMMGKPSDLGWGISNNVSLKGKFSSAYALDVQLRFQNVLTNDFTTRWQGARIGFSGMLARIETERMQLIWTGAVNTDLPGTGQVSVDRKVAFNPGLFSNLIVRPRNSRWSLYTFLSPRIFFYSDPLAMDPQSLRQGLSPGDKPSVAFFAIPSVNYDLTDRVALRSGVTLNITRNTNSSSFQRWFMPVDFGVSYKINSMLSLYPNVSVSGPWDDGLRQGRVEKSNLEKTAKAQRAGKPAPAAESPLPWTRTASIGLWLSGTLF